MIHFTRPKDPNVLCTTACNRRVLLNALRSSDYLAAYRLHDDRFGGGLGPDGPKDEPGPPVDPDGTLGPIRELCLRSGDGVGAGRCTGKIGGVRDGGTGGETRPPDATLNGRLFSAKAASARARNSSGVISLCTDARLSDGCRSRYGIGMSGL